MNKPKVRLKPLTAFFLKTSPYFIFHYLFIFFIVDPRLICQVQQPYFYTGRVFFSEFLYWPGGIAEYVSAFFPQFYCYPWLGALIVTLSAWILCFSALILIIRAGGTRALWPVSLVPCALLLVLQSSYFYYLSFTLAIFLSVSSFNIYMLLTGRAGPFHRFAVFLILALVLYYLTAGPFFIFAVLCCCRELFNCRNVLSALIYAALSALIPYFGAAYLFPISYRDAYMCFLKGKQLISHTMLYSLCAFFPLLFLLTGPGLRIFTGKGLPVKKNLLLAGVVSLPFQTVLITVAAGIAAFLSLDINYKEHYLLDLYARQGRWEKALVQSRKAKLKTVYTAFQFNRALYHSGALLDSMFSFNQAWGPEGLLLIWKVRPEDYTGTIARNAYMVSDIFFDLGYVNGSEHWAQEGLTSRGKLPYLMQRMVFTTILGGDEKAAERYLAVLSKSFIYKNWADRYKRLLISNSAVSEDSVLGYIRSRMVSGDFMFDYDSGYLLRTIFHLSPNNKMAFEYLVADLLLEKDLELFFSYLPFFRRLGYQQLPVHVQEALILYMARNPGKRLAGGMYQVRSDISQEFMDFSALFFGKYDGDKVKAKSELRWRFGGRYWFYYLME